RREWLRPSHRPHGIVVEYSGARRIPQLDECEPAVLGDVELEQELALEAPVARLARVDPLGLDLLPDFLEVVLVLGLRGVERDRLALDAPPAASKPASARLPKDAGRGR